MNTFAGLKSPLFTLFMALFFSASVASGAEVTISGYNFEPKNLEIKAGETVKWINTSTLAHTITSGDNCKKDEQFDSGVILPQKMKPEKSVFEKRFDTPGVYKYICKTHCEGQNMTGVVTVK